MSLRNVATAPAGSASTAAAHTAGFAASAHVSRGSRLRRRGILTLTVAVLVVTGLALAFFGLRFGNSAGQQTHPAVTPRLFASQPPYVGVACRYSNSTRCGRVGVAVWFRHRPSAVKAVLGTMPVALSGVSTGGKVFTYIGYVHLPKAVLRIPRYWTGVPVRYFALRVVAHLGSAVEVRTFRVQLHPGWG